MPWIKYINDTAHYNDVLSRIVTFKNHFDGVWAGFRCQGCGRRKFCGDPIDER